VSGAEKNKESSGGGRSRAYRGAVLHPLCSSGKSSASGPIRPDQGKSDTMSLNTEEKEGSR
jgi:hypothetical protein